MIKRVYYKLILGLLVLITLVLVKPQIIQAEGVAIGNSIGSTDSMKGGNQGGPSYARTAWLCVLCDENGQKILNSQVAFFPYGNSTAWMECNGTITTEFFGLPMTIIYDSTYLNTIPAFQGSTPGGPILKNYLLQQCNDTEYVNNAMMVVDQYLGVTPLQIEKAIASGQEVYLQYTPIFYCKKQGQTKDSQEEWWISNSEIWSQVNPAPSFIASATHRNFPQSSALEMPWFGLGCVSSFKGAGQYWEPSEWRSNGLGLGAIKISDGHQVTITVEQSDGTSQTQYLSCGNEYTVQAKIGNAELVTSDSGFVSKTYTNAKSASATYSEVIAGQERIGSYVGPGNFDFIKHGEGSMALFLHYKGDIPKETTSNTDLYSYEILVRLPGCKSSTTTVKRTDKGIEHHSFNDLQNRVESWQNAQIYEHELVKQIEVDRSVESDHSYSFNQNHGAFDISSGIWQLYRAPYINEWEEYPSLFGRIFTVDETVDGNYGYYLGRSHLEGLTLVADRENASIAELYLSKSKPFVAGYEGREGANQSSNSTKTWSNIVDYNYSYVPRWSGGEGAWIMVDKYTRKKLPHEDSCFGDNDETADIVETDHLNCEETHYTEWEFKGTPRYTAPASKFYTLTGSYGSHSIDKYKAQSVTGTGISGHAGSHSEATAGVALKGKFVKGEDFDYCNRISKAIHGSQFPETYKLYGEVPMLLWIQGNTYTYDTMKAETAFVFSEYQRSLKPSLVHSFKAEITGSGQLEGIGSVSVASTGHTAENVKKQSSATSLGCTYMGTTFNVATTNSYYLDFYTLGVVTEDERSEGINANSAWGNEHSSVQAAHQAYVNSVTAGLQQEIIMELTFKPSGKKLYYTMLDGSQGVVKQTPAEKVGDYDLWWKNNSFADNSTDYSGFYDNGIAESYLNLRELFDGTLINNNESHEGQSNDSEQAQIKDVVDYAGGSYNEYLSYNNFYDEESYYRFETEKWHTRVTMDMLSCSDKIDYNLLTQSVLSNYLYQKDFIEVRFYGRLWRDTDADYTDGFNSWPSEKTFRVDKIQNADFTVINQSTEDLKK